MERFGYDVPNGTVIGDITSKGALFYDGRQQGQDFFATTDTELVTIGKTMMADYKADCPTCYKNGGEWEVRIYGGAK